MIAPELRRQSADRAWPADGEPRLDPFPSNPPATQGSTAGHGIAHALRWRIDAAAARQPWIVVTAAAVVGITAGWLAKRR